MKVKYVGGLAFVLFILSSVLLPISPTVQAAPSFADEKFKQFWEYSDKIVDEVPNVGRFYTWGTNSFGTFQEDYQDAPDGRRKVQYFDKSRMEISADGQFVTNGLLTVELVTGRRQDGNTKFTNLEPSDVQIAGDDNRGLVNAFAPTYASFRNIVTTQPGENTSRNQVGQRAYLSVDRGGGVTSRATYPGNIVLGAYEPVTGHNIPQIFLDYQNIEGQVWNGQAYVTGKVYTNNPTANVFGYPITEPYFVDAYVANRLETVLVQLYERRVLTYVINQSNAQVEMGNVGQHYARWRYQPKPTLLSEFGRDTEGLLSPQNVALDEQGNSYVYSAGFHRIHKFDAKGQLITKWGKQGNQAGQFGTVRDLATDKFSNLYVLDDDRVQKFDSNGRFITQWGSHGEGDGQFNGTTGITTDNQGNIFVSELYNYRVQKFDPNGQFLTKFGLEEENGINAYQSSYSIRADGQGNFYTTQYFYATRTSLYTILKKFDLNGRFLQKWQVDGTNDLAVMAGSDFYLWNHLQLRHYDNSGKLLTSQAISGDIDGESFALFGLAVDKQGNAYFDDLTGNVVRKFDTASSKFVASWGGYGRADGQLRQPFGVAVDKDDNIYVVDSRNYRIQKFDSTGRFIAKWGDKGTADGQFLSLRAIAVDEKGNSYVSGRGDNNGLVQKFDSTGKFVTKLASFGQSNSPWNPAGIAVDKQANVYVVDSLNRRVQKFDSTGRFLTAWDGSGGDNSQLVDPTSIALDNQGNLFIVDPYNSIKKFDSNGRFILQWGKNLYDGGQLNYPTGIAIDSQNNVYVVNQSSHNVQVYTNDGSFLTEWGSFWQNLGQFNSPMAVAITKTDNILVTDQFNDLVQIFSKLKL